MRYRFNNIFTLLQTPLGRMQLRESLFQSLWPVIGFLAVFYRRVIISKTCVVVVVGSFGKTTTMRAVIAALGVEVKTSQFRNSLSFVARELFRIRPGSRHAVIEVGIERPGEMQKYVNVINPNIVVVTSIGSEHNRSFGTLERTREEKCKIVRFLSRSGIAVLNGDDSNVRWMQSQTKARVITFGFDKSNYIHADDITLDWPKGMSFMLHVEEKSYYVQTRLIGRYIIYSILAAIAVALAEGFKLNDIISNLQDLEPAPGRLEVIKLNNDSYILRDDFKSPLETIHVALDVLSEISAKRKIVVMGEVSEPPGSMGPIYRDIGKRIGKIASRLIVVGDNFQRYGAGVRQSGYSNISIINAKKDLEKAANIVSGDLQPGDVVLIKGRNTQRMERISLMLTGCKVKCSKIYCDTKITHCDICPMLERG